MGFMEVRKSFRSTFERMVGAEDYIRWKWQRCRRWRRQRRCWFCKRKKDRKEMEVSVADEKRSGVSGPIWTAKMYNCAQCTMQERSVCGRDVPCLAHMEQGPGPLHPEHLSPSLSAWVLGTQSTSSSQQGWTWTVEWMLASSPTQNLWSWKMYVDLVLYFHLVILSFGMLIKWLSAYCWLLLYFLVWLTTTWNKQIPLRAFITFSWAALRTVRKSEKWENSKEKKIAIILKTGVHTRVVIVIVPDHSGGRRK
jgi:hypothetical protein